jgi:hypothetical protein
MITLSAAGSAWGNIQPKLKRLRERMKRRGAWEDVVHVEPNPLGTGTHVHLWQHGDPVEPWVLEEHAREAGFGTTWMGPRTSPPDRSLCYGMKSVMDEAGAGGRLSEKAETFLRLNNGRLHHATHKFWRDRSGNALNGVREAMRGTTQEEWALTNADV